MLKFLAHATATGVGAWRLADLKDLDLPWYQAPTNPSGGRVVDHPSVRRWAAAVASSDGFVRITPEYNYGYPAALKNAIDRLYDERQRRPVAVGSYGGRSGGVGAAEQLRQVACELDMVPIRQTAVIPPVSRLISERGRIAGEPFSEEILPLVEGLAWRASALKAARGQSADA